MTAASVFDGTTHPLEHNEVERHYFLYTLQKTSRSGPSAYRRAIEAATGGLPTWAMRGKPGRKQQSTKEQL
ncbi:hypothetical protein FHW67_003252 [Herbaspirillum sp. Sphag1AN]|uniref:hypothetical protein n=1 Tax=Herbaspirillum sp. Sphag64 TaxID=2587029 RepID=UPI00161D7B39|nr:hypothetical protein [Herbaspirillum sp. Sphag64]MBB3213946.1 hypothetical protein [Herbaspirillum sp. Sphag1AN]MBB3247143.1 hypothetical protein [Herbaspirillum sp. Sphag64]